MPALVKRRVGSSAGIRDEEGTRRWPRSSKYFRNASRTSAELHVFFMGRFHHGRDGRGGETPPDERRADAPPAGERRQAGRFLPRALERAGEGRLFRLAGSGERLCRRLLRKAEHRELLRDARAAVAGPAGANDGPCGREVVEPALRDEAPDGVLRR